MKLEEYIESIFGCLERIENKINGLSAPLLEGNSPTVNNEKEKDESVLNEVKNGHETFRKLLARMCEGLAAIKNDMISMDRKNSSQERLGQVLSEMRDEQRQNQEKVENLFCETNDTIRKNAVKTSNINHHFSLSIKSPYILGSFSVMFATIVILSVALYGRDYFFQNVLLNRTRTVNISRRPTIIRMDKNILAKSCRFAKLSIGPISPNPGPTLLILEITALQAVAIS